MELKDGVTTEYDPVFLQGMIDRMSVSYHKYGPAKEAYPHKVNSIGSLRQRLELYDQTGNTEWLIDVANQAMLEFMFPAHPDAHYRPTESDESPGRTWQGGRVSAGRNTPTFHDREGD